jgi:DNA polymerase
MGWASAVRKPTAQTKVAAATKIVSRSQIETAAVDWDRLVSLDFETYYDADYTLSKLSTSEYVRDERFEASMVGIKIGNKKTKVVPHNKIAAELAAINWETHSVLCHNVQFDGFILSHHYGVFPKRYYCTLGMARGLHSNEIGAGLHDVSLFYGGKGKIDGGIEGMKGTRFKELFANKPLWKRSAEYCANDVDEMFRIFCAMHPLYPAKEMDLIHMTARMFCAPVLKVDIPRVQTEYEREVTRRETLLLNLLNPRDYDDVLDGKDKKLEGKERDMRIVKKVVGSNERFVALFEALGIARDQLPRKLSPAWMKKNQAEREEAIDSKWAFAFAKDDLDFINMPEQVWEYFPHLDPANPDDVLEAAGLSEKLQQLIDTRIAVKSTTNITRAERFLKAGANGMSLPVGYAYYRAHTGRWGGNNKMNMQNLTRGGELRLSILAAKGHQISVADSGQIEARVNAWLWDQFDLLDAFRDKRDVYSEFATDIYGRKITKEDKNDRHVGKVCVLGLGYQMGAPKLQMTLAKGALGGPKIALPIDQCQHIVNTYRRKYYAIKQGWDRSKDFIEHMSNPDLEPIQYKCLEIGFEYIRLPNGMCLKYPDLRMAKGEKGWDEWSYQSGDIRKKIYGGLLCENLVQALARIIVAEQMLMIDTKYPVVMTTHDEAVTHPKTKDAAKCYAFMEKCMTTPLWWCPEIPLAAEGGFSSNYSK